jgi:PBP1b-binding outer membrane lipoprotein LpoB
MKPKTKYLLILLLLFVSGCASAPIGMGNVTINASKSTITVHPANIERGDK